jgi:hypothetical protein
MREEKEQLRLEKDRIGLTAQENAKLFVRIPKPNAPFEGTS